MGEIVNPYSVARLDGRSTDHYWPMIEKELDRVPHIWQNKWTKDGLRNGVLSGGYQLWAAGTEEQFRIIVFTMIGVFEAEKTLAVFLAFGNGFNELFPILEATLTRYAQMEKCRSIDVVGREGFAKWLEPCGFEKVATIFSRKVQQLGVH